MPVLVDNGWIGEYDFEQEHGRIMYAWSLGWRLRQNNFGRLKEFEFVFDALKEGLLSYELINLYAPDNVIENFERSNIKLALEGMLFIIAATLARKIPEYKDRYFRLPWAEALKDPAHLENIFVETKCDDREGIKAVLGL